MSTGQNQGTFERARASTSTMASASLRVMASRLFPWTLSMSSCSSADPAGTCRTPVDSSDRRDSRWDMGMEVDIAVRVDTPFQEGCKGKEGSCPGTPGTGR